MIKLAAVVFITATTIAASGGTPIWEVSNSWICKTTKARYCSLAMSACNIEPGEAIFQIDFQRGIFKTLGGEAKFDDHLVGKKFYANDFGDGMSKVWLDSGDNISFAVSPRTGITEHGNGFDFTASRVGFKSQSIYYGTCYPA